MTPRYVAFEGNIGAGKTTLAQKIAQSLDARLVLEEFKDNPFLPLFYKQPERYAFSLEMAFLADRYHQLQQFNANDLFQPVTIADYSLYKSLIFAQNNLKEQELNLYQNLFNIIARSLKKPDLIIYFNRPIETLLQHIRKRNRSYEQNIKPAYLQDIQSNYINYFKQHPTIEVLVLNADEFDFLDSDKDFTELQSLIFQKFRPGLNFYNLDNKMDNL